MHLETWLCGARRVETSEFSGEAAASVSGLRERCAEEPCAERHDGCVPGRPAFAKPREGGGSATGSGSDGRFRAACATAARSAAVPGAAAMTAAPCRMLDHDIEELRSAPPIWALTQEYITRMSGIASGLTCPARRIRRCAA